MKTLAQGFYIATDNGLKKTAFEAVPVGARFLEIDNSGRHVVWTMARPTGVWLVAFEGEAKTAADLAFLLAPGRVNVMVGNKVSTETSTVDANAGEYWLSPNGWMAITPNGLPANLKGHKVTEHEDGTISVEPSILCDQGEGQPRWHGFLRHGIWTECD